MRPTVNFKNFVLNFERPVGLIICHSFSLHSLLIVLRKAGQADGIYPANKEWMGISRGTERWGCTG